MSPAAANAAVAVNEIVRRFGDVVALSSLSLDVGRGQFVSLLGPSGCGKTTLLRIIAGLDRQDSGEVWVDGHDISRKPAHRRPVNLVFQRYALFPHKTVRENVGFSLMLKRAPKAEIAKRVEAMLELVRLPGYGKRRIDQLSGGQSQRVALARALIDDPPVLLLDEPLAALDLKLRQAMHIELREIQRRVGSTFVYVTHDQEEALVMSDRVVLMNHGAIVQDGPPQEVYHRPRTRFAATFLGEANLFDGRAQRDRGALVVTAGGIRVRVIGTTDASRDQALVCLRPERVSIAAGRAEPGSVNRVSGTVGSVVFLGSVVRYVVGVAGRNLLVEQPAGEGTIPFASGAEVVLSWDGEAGVVVEDD